MRNLVCHQDKMLSDIVSNCSQHRPKGILKSWGTNWAEGAQLASEMLLQCPSRSQYWDGSHSHLLKQEHPYPSFLLLKEGWMFGLIGNSGNINAHWCQSLSSSELPCIMEPWGTVGCSSAGRAEHVGIKSHPDANCHEGHSFLWGPFSHREKLHLQHQRNTGEL